METKIKDGYGLVFTGGGGRGAYQIGVWKALEELRDKYPITAVSGASVGALNAALFACGDIRKAENIWTGITPKDILGNPAAANGGVLSQEGIEGLIKDNGIDEIVSCSKLPCYISCYCKDNGVTQYPKLNELKPGDIRARLASSCAIPVVFHNKYVNGEITVDGGIGDNRPIKPLYDEGIRKFIVVELAPDVNADTSDFPGAEFTHIKPSENIYVGHTGIKHLDDGLLDFEGKNAATRIELGHSEGLRQLSDKGELFCSDYERYMRSRIARIAGEYADKIGEDKSRKLYIESEISEDHLSTALGHYAHNTYKSDVIALFNNTLTVIPAWLPKIINPNAKNLINNPGNDGFLITNDGIVISLLDTETVISFQEITDIDVRSKLRIFRKDRPAYEYGGRCIMGNLKEMLEKMIDAANDTESKNYRRQMQERAKEIIRKYAGKLGDGKSKKLYAGDDMTLNNRLDNAMNYYAHNTCKSDVLALYDNSLDHQARDGFLITGDRIALSDYTGQIDVKFSEISAIAVEGENPIKSRIHIYTLDKRNFPRHNRQHIIYGGDCDKNAMREMLIELRGISVKP